MMSDIPAIVRMFDTMLINKPTVHLKGVDKKPVIGQSVLVLPIDHPSDLVSNTTYARTSDVVKINIDGFETMNTIYKYVNTN